MLRFTRQLAHVDDECGKLEWELNDGRQVMGSIKGMSIHGYVS